MATISERDCASEKRSVNLRLLPTLANFLYIERIFAYMKKLVDNRQSKAQVNRILDQYAQFVEKDLSLPSTLLKMGPMLGLMGTLIPMGPALVGLSTGDIASMAYNMQVAFATTVVGLFSAAIGFVTKQTKNRWYTEDMSNLEFMADLLEEK